MLQEILSPPTPDFWQKFARDIATAPFELPNINMKAVGGGEFPLTLEYLAEVIGNAYARSRAEDRQEFGENDGRLVADIAKAVAVSHDLALMAGNTMNEANIYALIEKILLSRNDRRLAVALLSVAPPMSAGAEIKTRVIRRGGDIVEWNRHKIVLAIRKAMTSEGVHSQVDGFADRVADSATAAVVDEAVPYIDMPSLQDLVIDQMTIQLGRIKDREVRQQILRGVKAYIVYRTKQDVIREHRRETEELVDTAYLPGMAEPVGQIKQVVLKQADGSTSFWDGTDLRSRMAYAAQGLDLCISPTEIQEALTRSIADGLTPSELQETVRMNSKTLVERDADFTRYAARIFLSYIYEETLGWDIVRDGAGRLRQAHRERFSDYIKRGVEIERLNPVLLEYDLEVMAEMLDPAADLRFDFVGVQTVYDRYLIVDKTGAKHQRIECPQFFWMRVSMGLALREPKEERTKRAKEIYSMVKDFRFCPSTPTLFNAGTRHSQLSSCYLSYVGDSIEAIFQRGISENSYLSKWAGGLGTSWTSVRGTGAHIAGTNGESQGVIPFLKLHNDQLVAVNQGGKRKGAGCAYVETWHNDIFEFLELRKNTGDDRRRTHDMNTANWIPDLFMKRVENRQPWTLFRSNEVKDLHHIYGRQFEAKYVEYEKMAEEGKIYGQKIEALDLWKKMLSMLFETGHPWITFKDPCNIRSPQDHAGVIHSSNLCTEICLNTSNEETAVCNLASVILDNHLDSKGNLDPMKLRETVRVAVRALDNVIELNFYPTQAARRANLRHRPVGLGIMGLQYALYRKRLPFASEDAMRFNHEAMEAVAYFAYEASSDLAVERGKYLSFPGSKWDRGILPMDTVALLAEERGLPISRAAGVHAGSSVAAIPFEFTDRLDWNALRQKIKRQGMRNSNVLAIAPTATISNITSTSPCIEPAYKNLYVESNLSGEFTNLNPFLVKDLKARRLWNKEMLDQLKYHDGELDQIVSIPADLKAIYQTAFGVPFGAVIDAAAIRGRFIDQAQSLNLWLPKADLKTLSLMYRSAWHAGLKTTYYLRTLGASSVEKATVDAHKEVRISASVAGTTGDERPKDAAALVQEKRTYTAEEKVACSIEAMRKGDSNSCEACQ